MFALVDCNSFYASCEQIFRPDLRGKPVVVLSNNDGCIVARNRQAKEVGIPDLQAYFQVRDQLKAKNVATFSSNYALYGDTSNRINDTLLQFCDDIEIYSIDESFLNVSGMTNLESLSRDIRKTIWQHIRIPVSIGVAPTKTLAKLANHKAKKTASLQGIYVIDSESKRQALLTSVAIDNVWGVGRRTATKLRHQGISSANDLACANKKMIRKLGHVTLERTARELNGEPCIDMEPDGVDKKHIYSTRSFGNKVTEKQHLYEAVSHYAARACQKLRQQQSFVKTITVFIKTSPHEEHYYSRSASISLQHPTDDNRVVIHQAKRIIDEIFKPNRRYLKAGVGLIELVSNAYSQTDLFSPSAKHSELMETLDNINQRFGRNTAFIASQGAHKVWRMRRQHLSPQYTTCWQDIVRVKI